MYLHLGKGSVISTDEIIGIFDLDITSQSHLTRSFLAAAEKAGQVINAAEKAGQVINAAEDIPKSFIAAECAGKRRVYLSQMAAATLLKRAEAGTL